MFKSIYNENLDCVTYVLIKYSNTKQIIIKKHQIQSTENEMQF